VKRERQLGEKNFFIPRDVKDLNFEAHVAELRNFLLERARETSRTKEEIAEKLHISRQTLHNWMKSGGD
jgi:transcriptional regulator with PAS, ATPase and Fis domain